MPLDNRDEAVLDDVLRFANDVVDHVGDQDFERFVEDRKTQQAVMYAVATVAEATHRLSDDFKSRRNEIPWPMIWGMRNIMLHEYGRVDLPTVHRVATEEIPRLIDQIRRILSEERKPKE